VTDSPRTHQASNHPRATLGVTVLVGLILLFSACTVVRGSGQPATESRSVAGFSRVDLIEMGEVTISEGAEESLSIEADGNLLSSLTSDVVDGTLRLGHRTGVEIASETPIRYRVTVKDLAGVTLSGAGMIIADNVDARELAVDLSGSGVVRLSGSAERQQVDVSGLGRYEAARLESDVVTAAISGAGEVFVTARRELDIDISGSGTLTYSGDPRVRESISGTGKVVKNTSP
jgi:hypothetical protein